MRNRWFLAILFFLGLVPTAMANFKPHDSPIVDDQGPKPNVMLLIDTSSAMQASAGYNGWNLMTATKNVLKDLIETYGSSTNIGLARYAPQSMKPIRFNRPPYIAQDAALVRFPIQDLTTESAKSQIKSSIDRELYIQGSGSPSTGSLYEVGKYFRGEPSVASMDSRSYRYKTFQSPVEYRCQMQHIVVLNAGGSVNDGLHNVTNDDKVVLLTDSNSISQIGTHHRYSVDLRKAKNKVGGQSYDKAGKSWLGSDTEQLMLHSHGITYGESHEAMINIVEMEEMAEFANNVGRYVRAFQGNQLSEAYRTIFKRIGGETSVVSSLEDQVTRTPNSIRYTLSYDHNNWTSQLKAYQYYATTAKRQKPIWDTWDRIKPNQGQYITINQQGKSVALTPEAMNLKSSDQAWIDWIKGVDRQGLTYRPSPLSDAIGSNLIYVGKDQLNINFDSLSNHYRDQFLEYLVHYKMEQMPYNFLVMGTNDGLMNFIIAEKESNRRGGERYMSYFPRYFHNDIESIVTQRQDDHSFRMDGPNTIFDAVINGQFRTIGLSSFGSGGKGLVAYQIFAKDDPEIKALYEIDQTTEGFSNLGYAYSEIALYNRINPITGIEEAVGVFGNGISDTNNISSLYIINAYTGALLREIVLSYNGGGASSPEIIVDLDPATGLQRLRHIYVGDQSGKLYRVDFNVKNPKTISQLEHRPPIVLFEGEGDQHHPITVRPILVKERGTDDIWAFFGTGRALDYDQDRGPQSHHRHYFYGLRDTLNRHNIQSTDLLEQKIISETKAGELITTDKPLSRHHAGWKFNLNNVKPANGERVIAPAVMIFDDVLQFSTYGIKEGEEGDPCIVDITFGKTLFVDPFSGKGSRIMDEKYSGKSQYDRYYHLSTGTGISSQSQLSGNRLLTTIDMKKHATSLNLVGQGSYDEEGQENLSDCAIQTITSKGDLLCIEAELPSSDNDPLSPRRLYIKSTY